MEADRWVPVALLSETRTGSIVTVQDEGGREHRGRVLSVEGKTALVRIFEELDFPSESSLWISLLQAVPKWERMEFVIQKATELGVQEIIPFTSKRSFAPGAAGTGQDKSHRWPRAARRAVEQCRRRVEPLVAPCSTLTDALNGFSADEGLKLILYEKERTVRLTDLARQPSLEKPRRVALACGPEGGFTDEEISFARARGFAPVRLCGRVLRCETAALAALSVIQHEWGDL
jgi:16S rRNA (uracil1498-N3)-methyltransferase